MEKGGKSGKKHQKIRKKYEIVLKSVFFVVLGDFLGVWGSFGVFFGFFAGFYKKKWFGTAKTAGRTPLQGGGNALFLGENAQVCCALFLLLIFGFWEILDPI